MPGQNITKEWFPLLIQNIKDGAGLRELNASLRLDQKEICLHMIVVEPAERGRGKGSQAMSWLVALADRYALKITLSPDSPNAERGTTSRGRLVAFYKQFGFVENKGRNKDFAISDGMYRDPKPLELTKNKGLDSESLAR